MCGAHWYRLNGANAFWINLCTKILTFKTAQVQLYVFFFLGGRSCWFEFYMIWLLSCWCEIERLSTKFLSYLPLFTSRKRENIKPKISALTMNWTSVSQCLSFLKFKMVLFNPSHYSALFVRFFFWCQNNALS